MSEDEINLKYLKTVDFETVLSLHVYVIIIKNYLGVIFPANHVMFHADYFPVLH